MHHHHSPATTPGRQAILTVTFAVAAAGLGGGCAADKGGEDTDPSAGEGSADTCPTVRDPRFDDLAAALDAERQALGAPGAAVALVLEGKLVYCEGFGQQHPETGGTVSPQTFFRMGSVNKMMTATALLQQVEAGRIGLDSRVVDTLESFSLSLDPRHEDITVQHLLTHQGAFYDYLEIDSDHDDAALADAVEGWFDEGMVLLAPPGRFWNYANPNWYVAGRIVEVHGGLPYTQYMDEAVFSPLGMTRTSFDGEAILADGDYASGLTVDWTGQTTETRIAGPDSYDNAWARPAGYAWTSAEDLARFGQFLLQGDPAVLPDAPRQEMMTPQVSLGYLGDVQGYGYGLFTDTGLFLSDDALYPLPLVYHGGDISGFAADLYTVPGQGFALALLASTDYAHFSSSVEQALRSFLELPEPIDPPAALEPDPSTHASLAGDYAEPWGIIGDFSVSLDRDGQTLTISCPLLDENSIPYSTTLTPYTRDNFIYTVQGYPLLMTFLPSAEDGVTYARTRLFVGTREDNGDTRRSARPAFDPARLEAALRTLPPLR